MQDPRRLSYGLNKEELVKFIGQLAADKRIEGISNVNDESDKDGMRIVIDAGACHCHHHPD